MRYLFALSASILCCLTSFAQAEQESTAEPARKLAVKVYNMSTLRPTIKTGNYSFVHEFREHDYLQPTVAVRIENKKKNFHEVELSELAIRRRRDVYVAYVQQGFPITTAGTQVTSTSLAARYEYVRPLFKKQDASLVPAIGVAGSLFYERFKTTPYTTNVFPIAETMGGMRGFIVPRLNWYLGKRLFFDLNVPVCVLQAGYQHSNQKNPVVSEQFRSMGLIKFDFLPHYYSFRVGAGWKF